MESPIITGAPKKSRCGFILSFSLSFPKKSVSLKKKIHKKKMQCSHCKGTTATTACMSCLVPLCKFCSDRHAIHRRYRSHVRGSLADLKERLDSERNFVNRMLDEKEKREETKRKKFKDAQEKHFVSKEEHPREKTFNEAASYILNRTEKRNDRLLRRRNSQIESVDTVLQRKNQWLESMIRIPRVFPEKGIHDELVDANLYTNTGQEFVSRGNTSPLRRLLDRHRRDVVS